MDIDEKEKTIQKNDIIECPKCSLNINDSCNNETKTDKIEDFKKLFSQYFLKSIKFIQFLLYPNNIALIILIPNIFNQF